MKSSNSKKQKICTLLCDVAGGGAENVVINYFTNIDRSHYQLDLITYGISNPVCESKFRDLGFNIYVIPPKQDGFIKSLLAMRKIIKNGKYDVVHAHITEWNCLPMMLAWFFGVKKRISHAHTTKQIDNTLMNAVLFFQRILNNIFSNKLCACGMASAEYLYYKNRIMCGDVTFIHNAIDLTIYKRNHILGEEMRDELSIDKHAFCLGHIGRFIPVKNHIFLLDIFQEVIQLRKDSVLILVGEGELRSSIERMVKENGLLGKVIFLGTRRDVVKIYNTLDCFCLPSLSEGLPMVCIESQACGVPTIVASSVSDEVLLTNICKRIPLSCSAKEWAEYILEMPLIHAQGVFPACYNIAEEKNNWIDLYE